VLAQNGKSFRGVPIPLSFKSILFALLRTATFIGGMILALWAVVAANDRHPEPWILPAVLTALCWDACIALSYAPFCTRASFARACQIAEQLGLNEKGYAMLQEIYGEAPPRGFAVQQQARAGATAAARTPATAAGRAGFATPPAAARTAAPAARATSAARPASAPAPRVSRPAPFDDDGPIPLEPEQPAPQQKRRPGDIGLA